MGNSGSGTDLSEETTEILAGLFDEIDKDGSGEIDMEETIEWWHSNYGTINARAMFESIDADKSRSIDKDEWMSFWKLVKENGYSDKDIQNEIVKLKQGGSWNFIP